MNGNEYGDPNPGIYIVYILPFGLSYDRAIVLQHNLYCARRPRCRGAAGLCTRNVAQISSHNHELRLVLSYLRTRKSFDFLPFALTLTLVLVRHRQDASVRGTQTPIESVAHVRHSHVVVRMRGLLWISE